MWKATWTGYDTSRYVLVFLKNTEVSSGVKAHTRPVIILVSGSVFVLRRTLSLSGNIRVLTRLVYVMILNSTRRIPEYRVAIRVCYFYKPDVQGTVHAMVWGHNFRVLPPDFFRYYIPDIQKHVLPLCLKWWRRVFQNVRRWRFTIITTQDKVTSCTVLLLTQTV